MAARERVTRFRDWLHDHGLPATPQRIAIAEVVLGAAETISADEVAHTLAARGTPAGTATVYRTLDVLVASGLVIARDFAEGFRRFELADAHASRAQLLCTVCGHGEDVVDDGLTPLAERLARAHEYEIEHYRLQLLGTCAACRALDSRLSTLGNS